MRFKIKVDCVQPTVWYAKNSKNWEKRSFKTSQKKRCESHAIAAAAIRPACKKQRKSRGRKKQATF